MVRGVIGAFRLVNTPPVDCSEVLLFLADVAEAFLVVLATLFFLPVVAARAAGFLEVDFLEDVFLDLGVVFLGMSL